jgi:hypothetical protein
VGQVFASQLPLGDRFQAFNQDRQVHSGTVKPAAAAPTVVFEICAFI